MALDISTIQEYLLSNEGVVFLALFITLLFFYILRNKISLFIFITLPSTFFHELSHFIVSLVTLGRPVSFTIIPRRSENGWTLGSVASANSVWYNQGLISMAPFLLLVIAYYALINIDLLSLYINKYILGYLIANLIIGSIPSIPDFKLAIKKPFLFIVIIVYGWFYFF